jgi:hypothetical protein
MRTILLALLMTVCLTSSASAQKNFKITSPGGAWRDIQENGVPEASQEEIAIQREAKLIVQKHPNKGRTPQARAKIAKTLASQATTKVNKSKDAHERAVWTQVATMYRIGAEKSPSGLGGLRN